jgi:hypothetical protein
VSVRVGEQLYTERQIYKVFARWTATQAVADIMTLRILSRFFQPPRYLRFACDPKERYLKTGDIFDCEYRGFVDATGAPIRQRFQVISSHESPPGEMIKFEAQLYEYSALFRAGRYTIADAPGYAAATDAQKAEGMWWADAEGEIGNNDGYVWS